MSGSRSYDVVIVGAGHGGAQGAIALRQNQFAGTIAIIGDEDVPPYERPPLSKDYLSGARSFDRILIRPQIFWEEREIELLLGKRVTSVDPTGRSVALTDGTTISYGSLIWATGGAPRRLTCSGHDLAGVHAVRTRDDVDRMIGELEATTNVVVIGGGFIGLEAAAVLVKFGKRVTVLEAMDRVLARVSAVPVSRFYEAEHRAHGVIIRVGATVECIVEHDGRAAGVRLSDGTVLPADMVIVGIGIVPAVQPLTAAGALGGNGVEVDAYCRTSLPHIFAIGDCAAHANPSADNAVIRLESVQNANDQAIVAAKAIVGVLTPYNSVPWFWSNQFDLRLQTIGLSIGHDEVVVRGDPALRSFSVVYLKSGRVCALDCVNCTKDYVQGRTLVIGRARIDPVLLARHDIPLRELAANSGASGEPMPALSL